MHSIVSQGKVDAVLASRPEDRRHLVEEAAGLGKFKRRKHRAELKLARVATQVERARDVEDEVRKRLRPLALQATAAERAEKLAVELSGLRGLLARLDLSRIGVRRAEAIERRTAAALARRSTQEHLTAVLAERERAEAELSDAAGGREAALGALYRLQGAGERIALRRESATGLSDRLQEDLREAERALAARSDESLRALEDAARLAQTEARDTATTSGQAAERARHAHARLAALERAVAAAAEQRLAGVREERRRVEAGITEATGGQSGANRVLVALGTARARLTARHENVVVLAARLGSERDEAAALAARGGPTPQELEAAANERAAFARAAATERDDVAERARAARERLAALERSLAEREGIAPAARTLAEAGERLALASLEAEPGVERAVAAALAWRASAILATDPARGLALVERARAEGLGSLAVVVGGAARAAGEAPVAGARPLRDLVRGADDALRLVDGVWLVPVEQLLEARHGVVITAEGHGYDAERGELWFAGETPEAVLLEMDARRRALADEAAELEARVTAASAAAEEARTAAASAEEAYAAVAHLRDRVLDVDLLRRLADCASGLEALVGRAGAALQALEAPAAARVNQGAERATELGDELRRLAALEAEAQREATEALRSAQAAEVVVARLGGSLEGVEAGGDRDALLRDATESLAAADAAAVVARDPPIAPGSPMRRSSSERHVDRGSTRTSWAGSRAPSPTSTWDSSEPRPRRSCSRPPSALAPMPAPGGRPSSEPGSASSVRTRSGSARRRMPRASAPPPSRSSSRGSTPRPRRRSAASTPPSPSSLPSASWTRLRVEASRTTTSPVTSSPPGSSGSSAARGARQGQPAGEGGVRGREGAARGARRRSEQDLEDSLAELEKLRDELAETVQRRFAETFARGRSRTSTRSPARSSPAARAGCVSSDARGGGRRARRRGRAPPRRQEGQRLSLLSGGEKALGAISFLFALFLARPCPFYLLDEVEAALDDANVGALRRAPAPLRRPRAVHRDHAPEAHDGGRRRALRRHDGR